MKNSYKLLENRESSHKRKKQGGVFVYKTTAKTIDLIEINKILNYIVDVKNSAFISQSPIRIDLSFAQKFEDKLSYIIFECLCYELIVHKNCNLKVVFNCKHNILNEGIKYSFLKEINTISKKTLIQKFDFDIFGAHYRKKVSYENQNPSIVSIVTQDVYNFLKCININDDARWKISEVASELIDNALFHSKSDCLIDIDITNDYNKNNSDKKYYGINIVAIDFSSILFADGLAEILNSNDNILKSGRYEEVLKAKANHTEFFDDKYDESQFYCITAFQNKISSRKTEGTGGTGLTRLIKQLQDDSDSNKCYMISGNNMVKLFKNYMELNSDGWIGFNKSNDYIHLAPDKQCVCKSPIYIPGTTYHLTFIREKEDLENGEN